MYIEKDLEFSNEEYDGEDIFYNDNRYFSSLLDQCNSNTYKESFYNTENITSQLYDIYHYVLPCGLHVYQILEEIDGLYESIISANEIPQSQLVQHYTQHPSLEDSPIKGSFVSLWHNIDTQSIEQISLVVNENEAKNNYLFVEDNGYLTSNDFDASEIPSNAESLFDCIDSSHSLYKGLSKEEADKAKAAFKKIYIELNQRRLLDQLYASNRDLRNQVDTLSAENAKLKTANRGLRHKLRAVKEFMISLVLDSTISTQILKKFDEQIGLSNLEDPDDPDQ